jgi:hypothetical protein
LAAACSASSPPTRRRNGIAKASMSEFDLSQVKRRPSVPRS